MRRASEVWARDSASTRPSATRLNPSRSPACVSRTIAWTTVSALRARWSTSRIKRARASVTWRSFTSAVTSRTVESTWLTVPSAANIGVWVAPQKRSSGPPSAATTA
ncbi:MAG TPA: hypothetical protein VHV27_08680 [Phenylobacterium sp.]|nr:hypothetical protein [Phenylobacterium sp.]